MGEKPALRPVKNEIPPVPPGVYDVSMVSRSPVPVFQTPPRYPAELRASGIMGESLVSFIVDLDGTVSDAVVVSATDERFSEAALKAVVQWRFRPAQFGGTGVRCLMMMPITFTLNNN